MRRNSVRSLFLKWAAVSMVVVLLIAILVYSEYKLHIIEKDTDPSAEYFAKEIESKMVRIKAGKAYLDNDPAESKWDSHRTVHVDDFYISKLEVTQRQYFAVMKKNPSLFRGPFLPVENISYEEAVIFIRRLSTITGLDYRLPTEAEWKYSCLAGHRTRFKFDDEDPDPGIYAWYKDNSGEKTHRGGAKLPNLWGIYDMYGNVSELCLSSDIAEQDGIKMRDKVFLGSNWDQDSLNSLSTMKINCDPGIMGNKYGFRVVRDLTYEESAELNARKAAITREMRQIATGIEDHMILIPAGKFMMGSSKGDEDEVPVHRVKLDAFLIGKFEVTQREWEVVMGYNPSFHKGDKSLPVETVSWLEIQDFMEKLHFITGIKYRLPTEAEWEYACRAGTITTFFFGENDSLLNYYSWNNENSSEKTHPVGMKKPNPWGLYDIYGNVDEYCFDWKGKYSITEIYNPVGPSRGNYKMTRGGHYWSVHLFRGKPAVSSSSRAGTHLKSGSRNHGFRVARDKY